MPKTNLTKLMLLAIVASNMLYCTDEPIQEEIIWVENIKPEIAVIDGVMHFSNPDIFDKTIQSFKKMSENEMLAWSKSHSFNSILESYLCAKADEENIDAEFGELENMIGELSENNFSNKIKELTQRKKNLRQHNNQLSFHNNRLVGMKLHNYYVSPIVNTQGLVVIANNVLQYTDTQIKNMEYDSKLDFQTIVNTSSSEENLAIAVKDVSRKIYNSNGRDSFFKKSCSFSYDPDHSGDKTGEAYLNVVLVDKPIYRTYTKTVCECVELKPGCPYETAGDVCCLGGTKCVTTSYQKFLGWEGVETQIAASLFSYSTSCKWIFCNTKLSDASLLRISISQASTFNFKLNGSNSISKYNDNNFVFRSVYPYPNFTGPLLNPQIVLNFEAQDFNSGGLGGCTLSVSLH